MKVIKYNLIRRVNVGSLEEPVFEETKSYPVQMPYSEGNLEIAKAEAWQGIVEIADDGEPEPTPEPSLEDKIWEDIATAYQEGVESA